MLGDAKATSVVGIFNFSQDNWNILLRSLSDKDNFSLSLPNGFLNRFSKADISSDARHQQIEGTGYSNVDKFSA
jgi:hypothetical protein